MKEINYKQKIFMKNIGNLTTHNFAIFRIIDKYPTWTCSQMCVKFSLTNSKNSTMLLLTTFSTITHTEQSNG